MMRARSLQTDCGAAAAVEMALVMPLLLILLFGSVEAGNFFLSEHVVQKGVRDAARYAARLPLTNYPGCNTVSAAAETKIKKLARTGLPTGTAKRIASWSNDDMTTVSVQGVGGTFAAGGIYDDFSAVCTAGAPKVIVTAAVPYSSVLGSFGFTGEGMTLNAKSEAAVIGS